MPMAQRKTEKRYRRYGIVERAALQPTLEQTGRFEENAGTFAGKLRKSKLLSHSIY
jgi:hypothetical protein